MTMNTEPERRENLAIVVALALATVLSVGMILLVLIGHVPRNGRGRSTMTRGKSQAQRPRAGTRRSQQNG